MGQIIAVANQKGGVGKTTITVHLAVGMARRGQIVIVVDADPQGNTTSWLLDGDTSDPGLFRLLVVGDPMARVLRPISRWSLVLVPGNSRTGEALIFLGAMNRLSVVPGALAPLRELADLVLIDMPPSRAAGFQEFLQAADWVIVPTQLERLSLEGVALMARTVGQMQQGPRLMGIVPNMVRQTNEHKAQLGELVETFGAAVWPPLPLSVDVAEATSFGAVVFDHAPRGRVTQAMMQVVDRFAQVVVGGGGATPPPRTPVEA